VQIGETRLPRRDPIGGSILHLQYIIRDKMCRKQLALDSQQDLIGFVNC
jgi:hypothetical protein